MRARLIGVIEGQQLAKKEKVRNDRLVAVAEANHMYANVAKLEDLSKQWVKELADFFVIYHSLEGKQYELLGCKGHADAMALIKQSQKKA